MALPTNIVEGATDHPGIHNATNDAVNGKADLATAKGFVFYGADANVARPTGYSSVEWLGYTGVEPANAANYDSLIQVAAP